MRRRQYLAASTGVVTAFTTSFRVIDRVTAQEDDQLFEEFVSFIESDLADRGVELVIANNRRTLVELVVTTQGEDPTDSPFHQETGALVGAYAAYVGNATTPPALGLHGVVFASADDAHAYTEAGDDDGPEPFATYAANTEWALEAYQTDETNALVMDVLLTIEPPAF